MAAVKPSSLKMTVLRVNRSLACSPDKLLSPQSSRRVGSKSWSTYVGTAGAITDAPEVLGVRLLESSF